MLDVIIGLHTWNCQIRTHIHTEYTHTGTHTKKENRKGWKKKGKKTKREGDGLLMRVEERGY